jgi:hypothetical protein
MAVKEWLNPDGEFRFGKHEGEPLSRVRRDDPGYLHWIIETVEDITDEDRAIIETALAMAPARSYR